MAAEDGITQAVVDFAFTDASFFYFSGNVGDGLFDFHAVDNAAIDHFTCFCIVGAFRHIVSFPVIDNGYDGQVEVFGEGVVTAIVSRYSHDGSGSVAGKNVFTDPDGYSLVGERVDGIRSGEDSRNLFHFGLAFPFRAFGHVIQIFGNGISLFGSC